MRSRTAVACLFLAAAPAWPQLPSSISALLPAPNATGVPLNARVIVRIPCCFSTSTLPTISLSQNNQAFPGATDYYGSQWVFFRPARNLDPLRDYNLVVTLPSLPPFTSRFTTGTAPDTTPPVLVSTTPTDGTATVNPYAPIILKFSKPMNPQTPDVVHVLAPDSSTSYFQGPLGPDLTTIQAVPSTYTGYGRTYRVQPTATLPQDWLGNSMTAPFPGFSFSTYPIPPSGQFQFTGSIPANNETEVPTNSALYIAFNRQLQQGNLSAGVTLSDSSGKAVPVTVTPPTEQQQVIPGVSGFGLVVRPNALLSPHQSYVLKVAQIVDGFGNPLTAPVEIDFTTAVLPDLSPNSLTSTFSIVIPPGKNPRWYFGRRLNPMLIGSLPVAGADPNFTIAPLVLSTDGHIVEAEGFEKLAGPVRYNLVVFDRVEDKLLVVGGYIVPGATSPKAPEVVVTSPTEGAATSPSALIKALFDTDVSAGPDAHITLAAGDINVPVTFSVPGSIEIDVHPKQQLRTDKTYTLQLSGLIDRNGTAMLPFTLNFSATPDTPSDPFRLVSTDPPSGATGVDPNTPLHMVFNAPPDLLSLRGGFSPYAGGRTWPGAWSVDGNTATFTPSIPWPPTSVNWNLGITDTLGRSITNGSGGNFGFTVQFTGLPAPPTVLSATLQMTPDIGGVTYQVAANFSTPLSTLGSIGLYREGIAVASPSNASFGGGLQIIVGLPFFTATGNYTLVFNSSAKDFYGQSLVPYSFFFHVDFPSYNVGPAPVQLVLTTIPQRGSNIAPGGGISAVLMPGTTRAQFEQSVSVRANGVPLAGTSFWTPDDRVWTFRPAVPPAEGVIVDLLVSRVAEGYSNVDIYSFTVRSVQIPSGPGWILSTGGFVDLNLNRDLLDGELPNLTAKFTAGQQSVPASIAQQAKRVLRVRPTKNLAVSQYYTVDVISPGGAKLVSTSIQSSRFPIAAESRIAILPAPGSSAVPVNTKILIASTRSINPASANLSLQENGQPIPFTATYTNRSIIVEPGGCFRPNTAVSVSVTGWEDLTGQPVPPQSWTFQTGAAVDLTPAVLSYPDPFAGTITGASPKVVFNKPVIWPASNEADLTVGTGNSAIPLWVHYSTDGTALSFTGDGPLPYLTVIPFSPFGIVTLTGQSAPFDRPVNFETGPPEADLPIVTAVQPPRDDTNVPTNSLIEVRFAQPVINSSLTGITITAGGNVLPATVTLSSDGLVARILPVGLLFPSTVHQVAVTGVQNLVGQTMADSDSWSFQTSDGPDLSQQRWTSDPANQSHSVGLDAVLRITATHRLNTARLSETRVSLQLAGRYTIATTVEQDSPVSIRVKPAQPLQPNAQYYLSIVNWPESLNVQSSSGSFIVSRFATDPSGILPDPHTPPQMIGMIPANGATAPLGAVPRLTFDRSVTPVTTDGKVWINGLQVPASVAGGGQVVSVTPFFALPPNANIDVEIPTVMDAFGNTAGPIHWSFSTGATAPSFKVDSITPAQNSVGLPTDTAITAVFTAPVAPAQTLPSVRLNSTFGSTYPVTLGLDGNQLIVKPAFKWPGGATLSASVTASDARQAQATAFTSFTTAADPDVDPPVLEAFSPDTSARLLAGNVEVHFRFSEPILIAGSPIDVSTSSTQAGYSGANFEVPLGGDGRELIVYFQMSYSSTASVTLTNNITDLSGNRFVPQTLTFTSVTREQSAEAYIVSTSIGPQSRTVPVDQPLQVQFSQPMEETSTRAALSIQTYGGIRAPVDITSDDGLMWRLQPNPPLAYTTDYQLVVDNTAVSRDGVLLTNGTSVGFYTASPTATPAQAMLTPSGAAIRFSAPVPDAIGDTLMLRQGTHLIPTRTEHVSARWFKLVALEPLQSDLVYHLLAATGVEIPLRVNATGDVLIGVEPEDFQVVDSTGSPVGFQVRVGQNNTLRVRRFNINKPSLVRYKGQEFIEQR